MRRGNRRAHPTGRRRRRWPIAVGTVLVLVAAVAVVWVSQREGPDDLVAGSVADIGAWRGVSYRGMIADQNGITTGVQLTVTVDGAANGTLTREFGGEAQIAADYRGILISGNHQWWLTDQPAAAEALAGAWVDNPPSASIGLPYGLPASPSALAAELSRPGEQPWSELGRELVDGQEGLRLSDGVREVVVAATTPHRLLTVSLPRRGPPQVVPRAFDAPLGTPDSGEPPPDDQAEPSRPPQYIEYFTIDEPTDADVAATLSAAEAIRAANTGRQRPRSVGEFLREGAPVDAETISLVNRMAERGLDARAALPLSPGKAVLQVLDGITAGLTRTDPRTSRELRRATAGLVKAVQNRQFAALHTLVTSGNLQDPAVLRNFLQSIQKPETQAHLQAAARLAAAGNKLRIEVPYVVDGMTFPIDLLIDEPAEPGAPLINVELKRVTGDDRAVRSNTKEAAGQLARFDRSEVGEARSDAEKQIVLHIPRDATTDVGRLSGEALTARLREIDLYQACVDGGGGGACSVDRIIVSTEGMHEGRPAVVVQAYRPEELRSDPPPGAGTAPNDPAPAPAPGGGAAAAPPAAADGAAAAPAPEGGAAAPPSAPEGGADVPPPAEGAVVPQPEGGAVVPLPAPGSPPARESGPAGPTSLFAGQEDTVEGRGALRDATTQQAGNAPGGIDFSTLELRYLAEGDAEDGGSVRYAFSAEQLAGAPAGGGPDAAQQASDAFFVWLALPRSAFTVNLNPDEPDRIIDPRLGSTDAGRILLEADLQLKRTVAELIHPDTELGTRYWDVILGSGGQACQSFRQWIVPAPAQVWDNGDELYILDAPLEVKMETEYLQSAGVAAADACPQQPESVEEQNEDAFRTMILPQVERAVNEAPEYAALRQVYLSRIAAEWYRQRTETERLSFTDIVDNGDVTAWPAHVPWAPREVFDRYVESFTNGEFNVTRETREGDYIVTHTYVFGGVDWTQVSLQQTGPDQLQAQWPELAATVEDSFDGPAADRDGRIWLSAASVITAATASPPGNPTASPPGGSPPSPTDEDGNRLSLYVAIGVVLVAAGIVIRSWLRVRRRRGRSATGTGPPW